MQIGPAYDENWQFEMGFRSDPRRMECVAAVKNLVMVGNRNFLKKSKMRKIVV